MLQRAKMIFYSENAVSEHFYGLNDYVAKAAQKF